MSHRLGPTIADLAIAEGKAQGLAEGERKGQLRTARAMLRTWLEKQFGPLPEDLRQRIDTTDDPDRLQTAFEPALQISKLDDFVL